MDEAEKLSFQLLPFQLLRFVCDYPGCADRIRAARIVSGRMVPLRPEDSEQEILSYAVHDSPFRLKDVVALVDTLLRGGLLAQTAGPRPALVLTRLGFGALLQLESDDSLALNPKDKEVRDAG